MKLTVLSPNGGEYQQTIEVADDFDLPPISDRDDWVEIEGLDGSVTAVPMRLLVGVVLEGKGAKKKAHKGGRIN